VFTHNRVGIGSRWLFYATQYMKYTSDEDYKYTCLNVRCPERRGGKCNASEELKVLDNIVKLTDLFPNDFKKQVIGDLCRRPKLGDHDYSSGHSIDVNGNCNMGCC
jgi:hypothetical protein